MCRAYKKLLTIPEEEEVDERRNDTRKKERYRACLCGKGTVIRETAFFLSSMSPLKSLSEDL